MYKAPIFYNKGNRSNAYLVKEIMEATPQKLLIKIYDYAIVNCKKGNMVQTNNALSELINALRFDDEKAKNISTGLLKLYQFCQDEMRKKNHDIVFKILSDLREAWITIFNNTPN